MSGVDAHPYDHPWAIVKDLRVQIHELRMAFQAEQQQRAAEVTELRNEVAALKDALSKEKHERQGQCNTLTNDLTLTASATQKSIDELRFQTKNHVAQLNDRLQDEMRSRSASESQRDTRESTMKSELEAQRGHFDQEIGNQRHEHTRLKDEHAQRINSLMHDLGVLVDYLQKVGGSWDVLKGTTLRCTSRSVGSNSASTGNGGYPQN